MRELGKRLSLGERIFIPLILILLVFLGIRIFDLKKTYQKEVQKFEERFKAGENLFTEMTERIARENLKVALTLAALSEVQESIALEDRERLLGVVKPILARLQAVSSYPLKIHFHQPPGRSFLRVWKPDKYGDDLRSFRKTVVEVLRSGKPLYGVEAGRAGLAVRGIAPIFWAGEEKPVGSVEVFTSLRVVAKSLRRTARENNALFWIETVKTTAGTEKSLQRIGRFWMLLGPEKESLLDLIDETLLEKGLSKEFIVKKGTFLLDFVPVKDYRGKSVGVYVRFADLAPLSARLRSLVWRSIVEMFVFFGFAVVIILFTLKKSLQVPMEKALEAAARVARGELDQAMPAEGARELRELAGSLNRVIGAVGTYILSVQKGVRHLEEISARIREEVERLSEGSDRVKASNDRILELSESAAQGIDQIAAAVDQFAVAVQEILEHVTRTSRGVEEVKGRVNQAMRKIQNLAESSRKIDEILQMIDDKAEQTNLLALNATIEAARAGEAGKGFAVVAGEVKELAKQTSSATEDIRHTVAGIQQDVESTVAAMQEVEKIVSGVSEWAAQMAGAAEEQSAVINDIKANVARGANSVALTVKEVKEGAKILEEFLEIARGFKTLEEKLTQLAEEMRALSARFRVKREIVESLRD